MAFVQQIKQAFSSNLGLNSVELHGSVGGGDVSQSYKFEDTRSRQNFFVKVHFQKHSYEMFSAELRSVELIASANQIKTPKMYFCEKFKSGIEGGFIVMESLNFSSPNSSTQSELGKQLAHLHLTNQGEFKASESEECDWTKDKFGFPFVTWCGEFCQPNDWCSDWVEFYREHRFGAQLKWLSETHPHDAKVLEMGKFIKENLGVLFVGIDVEPSLLHGDLWAGNSGVVLADGFEEPLPVIYDPASYFGHHEAELSIMSMFGGYQKSFWDSYHSLIPKEKNFEIRQELYQSYHYLNHYNIFGSGYRSSVLRKLVKVKAFIEDKLSTKKGKQK